MWNLTITTRVLPLVVSVFYILGYAAISAGLVEAFRIQHLQQQQQQQHWRSPHQVPSFIKIRPSSHGIRLPSAIDMAAGGRGMSKSAKSTSSKATGMGMGSMSKGKEKKGSTSSGNTNTTPFNVNASLARLEKKYDELTKANAKVIRRKEDDEDDDDEGDDTNRATTESPDSETDETNVAKGSSIDKKKEEETEEEDIIVTSEYVVAVRAEGHVDDWVPIAQFCLARSSQQAAMSDGVTDPAIQAGISYYCRELSHVATLGSRIFQSIPRNLIQYSVETLDSFHKHVYETTISTNGGSSGSNKKDDPNNTNSMTKQDAREVLELVNGDAEDKSAIKRAYRTMSFAYHPDRFIGIDRTPEEIELAHTKYLRIQLAYETLNSGIRNTNSSSSISWYQSLGGKARTDFVGPISLISIESGKSILEMNQIESAITCMSPSIVQTFVARCK